MNKHKVVTLRHGDAVPTTKPSRHLRAKGYIQLRWGGVTPGVTYVCFEHRIIDGAVVPDDKIVHHKNGVPHDNRRSNLEVMDRGKHTGHHHRTSIKDDTEVARLVRSGWTNHQIAEELGAPAGTVSAAVARVGLVGYRNNNSHPGEKHPHSKLTEPDVVEIRRRFDAGERICDIAKDFPVGPGTISRVGKRGAWTHV